jgi:hypothetical protein
MKTITKLSFIALAALALFIACSKDTNVNKNSESNLRFTNIQPNLDEVNTNPFSIDFAGIYGNHMLMEVSYTGGQLGHEFLVLWDGVVQEINTKKFIDLKVYHKNSTDEGTQTMHDSLVLDISYLNISSQLLSDKNLFFNVVNTTNLSNVIVVPAVYSYDDGTTVDPNLFENIEVRVVSQGCNKGIWGDLWLKCTNSEIYLLPKAIESSIVYSPIENDILNITYERTWLADSTDRCASWNAKSVDIANIKALIKAK